MHDSPSLVRHAFVEQKNNNMEWYRTWITINNWDNKTSNKNIPAEIQTNITKEFISEWENSLRIQRNLEFYNSMKDSFGKELYLQSTSSQTRKAIARLQSSAHDLNIERGRYKTLTHGHRIYDRLCRFCCLSNARPSDLEDLPFYDPILETEAHALPITISAWA